MRPDARNAGWRDRSVRVGQALALALTVACTAAVGRGEAPEPGAIAQSELPPEAQVTYRLIREGGPFPHSKDGIVFGNRERLLPRASRGYYREYTVRTPGARDRGPRRIVCGGHQPTLPEACYYTDDHYASFRLIAQ